MPDPLPQFTMRWRRPQGRPILPYLVPSYLWALEPAVARRKTLLPAHLRPRFRGLYPAHDLDDSSLYTAHNLDDSGVRADVYVALLRDGTASEMINFMCCDLLAEQWKWLRAPREIRAAWDPLVTAWKERK